MVHLLEISISVLEGGVDSPVPSLSLISLERASSGLAGLIPLQTGVSIVAGEEPMAKAGW